MYVRRLLLCIEYTGCTIGTGDVFRVYQMDKKMPLVQETRFWCTNEDKTSVSGQWKQTVAEQ